MPQAVQDKLKTWVKHARTWHKSGGAPSWAREVKMRGAEWVSSTGQRLKELSVPGLEAKADEAMPPPQRESTEASSRVASRVGGTEAERRRKAMADIVAGRGGKKRPAEGEGGGAAPTPMGTGLDVKRSRGEGDQPSEAREARERKQAEKAARRAEKEQEEAARVERKAGKAARRAAKVARREARASGVQGGGGGEGEEEEEEEEEESDEESEEEDEDDDDSEQVFEDTMAKCDKVATKMRSALSAIIDKREVP